MSTQKRMLILFLILIAPLSLSLAQQKEVDSSGASRRSYQPGLKDRQINEVFHNMGITEEKRAELKAMGVNLREHLSRGEYPDYRVEAALSDVVLVGKVLRIINIPAPPSAVFHSKVTVKILDLLRGPANMADTVEIVRQSGLVLVHNDTSWVRVTNEPNFTVGEIAVFFLQNIYHSSFFTSAYKSFFSKDEPEFPDPTYWVQNGDKISIAHSTIDYYGQLIPITTFKSEVRQIARIVDQPSAK